MRCIMNLRTCQEACGHRVLALNRGEKGKILTVKMDATEEDMDPLS